MCLVSGGVKGNVVLSERGSSVPTDSARLTPGDARRSPLSIAGSVDGALRRPPAARPVS